MNFKMREGKMVDFPSKFLLEIHVQSTVLTDEIKWGESGLEISLLFILLRVFTHNKLISPYSHSFI